MNEGTFKKQLDKRERIWTGIMILLILIAFAGNSYYSGSIVVPTFIHHFELSQEIFTLYGGVLPDLLGFVSAMIITALMLNLILRPIDTWLRNRYLKEYYIEDCGDVIKLHGSVRLDGFDLAHKNLLSSNPDYKIIGNAYKQYGCTMAAIKGD